jgi:hypothetical protein
VQPPSEAGRTSRREDPPHRRAFRPRPRCTRTRRADTGRRRPSSLKILQLERASLHHVRREVAPRHAGVPREAPLAGQRRRASVRELLLREPRSRRGSNRGAPSRLPRERPPGGIPGSLVPPEVRRCPRERRASGERIGWNLNPAGCAAAMGASATHSAEAPRSVRAAMARAFAPRALPDSTTSRRPSRRIIARPWRPLRARGSR